MSKTTPEKCGYCGHPRSWHSDAHGYGGLVSCCVGAECACTEQQRDRLAALERVAEAAKEVPCHECGFAIGATDDLRGETQCYSCAPVRTALVLLDHE